MSPRKKKRACRTKMKERQKMSFRVPKTAKKETHRFHGPHKTRQKKEQKKKPTPTEKKKRMPQNGKFRAPEEEKEQGAPKTETENPSHLSPTTQGVELLGEKKSWETRP